MSIKRVTLHRFYNEHDIPKFGCGVRRVIALAPGRKWVTLVDPFTLDVAHVPLATWQRLRPEETEARRHVVVDAMKNRMQYFMGTDDKGKSYSTLTQAQKEAYAMVRA